MRAAGGMAIALAMGMRTTKSVLLRVIRFGSRRVLGLPSEHAAAFPIALFLTVMAVGNEGQYPRGGEQMGNDAMVDCAVERVQALRDDDAAVNDSPAITAIETAS